MPTILITGCSSGFGLETAKLFHNNGWSVIATMRRPESGILPVSDRLKIFELDVTDKKSISSAFERFTDIDVLVNNAGIGAAAPIEFIDLNNAMQLFQVNIFGPLLTMQSVLPRFRERRRGIIINVSSSGTLKPLPLVGAYRASKAALNALTESLAYEMRPFGVRVHIVLPGRAPDTNLNENSAPHSRGLESAEYKPIVDQMFAYINEKDGLSTQVSDVAAAIWQAATDENAPFKIAAGADAVQWLAEADALSQFK